MEEEIENASSSSFSSSSSSSSSSVEEYDEDGYPKWKITYQVPDGDGDEDPDNMSFEIGDPNRDYKEDEEEEEPVEHEIQVNDDVVFFRGRVFQNADDAYEGDFARIRTNLEEHNGGVVIPNLPMFYLYKGPIIFPGVKLWLELKLPKLRAIIKAAQTYRVGMICAFDDWDGRTYRLGKVGTTAKIIKLMHRTERDGAEVEDVHRVYIRAHQRFHIVKQWIDVHGVPRADVKIMKDVDKTPIDALPIPNFYSLLKLTSAASYRSYDRLVGGQPFFVHNGEFDWKSAWADAEKKWLKTFSKSTFSGSWAHKMYNSYYLAQKVAVMWKFLIGKQKLRLSRTGEEASIQSVKETNVFSFYIARMIAVDCDSLGHDIHSISIYLQLLLETNATSQRLRFLLRWLESYECLFCNKCESFVARRSNMLVMRQRATRALEYIHTDDACGIVPNSRPRTAGSVRCWIYTFYKVHNVIAIGSPDKTIWIFPCYSSTPVVCKNCGERVGWYFATDIDSKQYLKSFWGIWIDKVHNQDLPTDKCYH